MITPKEKAEELIEKFYNLDVISADYMGSCSIPAEECALICVNEIINAIEMITPKEKDYWLEVKKEIEEY